MFPVADLTSEKTCQCTSPKELTFDGFGCAEIKYTTCFTTNLTFNGTKGNLTVFCPMDTKCKYVYRDDWGVSANVCAIIDDEDICKNKLCDG